jgi:hypothetical protein
MANDVSLLADHRGGDETTGTERTVSELVKVLSRALRNLGSEGQADTASRLAAQAWVLCRDEHPAAAERLNGLMHYLARVDPSPVDHPARPPAAEPEE